LTAFVYDNCAGPPTPTSTTLMLTSSGDPCDPDVDGDAILNGSDPEADGDNLSNAGRPPAAPTCSTVSADRSVLTLWATMTAILSLISPIPASRERYIRL
jgi:hypothetical protein